jgi:amino acid adenylation domain-containing protein
MKNIEDIYPLSPMQQGMLFHTLYAPQSGVYFEQLSCTLQGDLDIPAFHRAWQRVVDRHPILRTCFVWEDLDEPLQIVRQQAQLPWEQHDWRECPPDKQQERLEVFLQADRERGFELSQAPLLRLALIRVSENTYHCIWSFHHALLDGWSTPLLLKEVFAFYEASRRGKDLHLERSRPYRDYIAWLQRQDSAKAEAFWRKTLEGFTAPTFLGESPTPDSALGQGSQAEQRVQLSVAATTALFSFARQHQLTVNTLVQGAWALLLSRYSGEDDVVFGATVSGRPAALAGVESMLGLFINTLPVRVQVSPEDTLLPWLRKLQAQQAEIRQYEYSPLTQIQRWSTVPRGLPLFESILVFENYPIDTALQVQGHSLAVHQVRSFERTNYPLTVAVATPRQELQIRIGYDSRRFDTATITRMAGHWQTGLENLVAQPRQRLWELPLLTEAERQQLLVEWNDTKSDCPQDQCIHQLFEAQVECTPEAIAVVFAQEQLTYGELNRRANQLAHYLRARGVGPEVRVGLCLERSLEMVIGLLGILKAGGAYVPLDPAYPPERLAFLLADTRALVLLTQGQLRERLPATSSHIVCLDADWQSIAHESEENPGSEAKADNLAYVMYTSGSTGQPKGVAVCHRGVLRLLVGVDYVHLDARACLLQMAPLAFDASTFELWGALLHGARCVLFPERIPTLAALGAVLREQAITTLWLTASLYNAVMDEAPEILAGLGQLLIGGEALSVAHVRRGVECLPVTQLINGYGPTEGTTFTCCYGIPRPLEDSLRSIPIGRPIGNTEVYVLDRTLQPVPIGVAGELYIGGMGLARGYLHRPDLTAERFLPHPFSPEPGARLYQTGDLARYLPDGTIEFLGRRDQQVKIRGFRIEPGEIEAVLTHHPAVREAVVLAREDKPGDKQLVAYVVPQQKQTFTGRELRGFLQQKLPEYMVPAVFVMVEALPLTPNGKVDRRALPPPEQLRPDVEQAFVAPRTPTEEVVAGLWAQVLGIEQVGVEDNFFELGGHSLLATQVLSRLRNAFHIELPLRALFEAPTVAGLAQRIEAASRDAQGLQVPPLVPVARTGALPLSFAQQRLWFLDQLVPDNPFYNIPSAARLTGQLNMAALAQSLNEVVRRHEALRTTFAAVDGQPVQVIAPTLTVPLPVIDLRALPEEEREAEGMRLAVEEAQRPFDLAQGPLLRVQVLRLGAEDNVVLLTMHHIISDGWSMGVLIRELGVLYAAFSQGQPSPLPALAVQYADFALWQRQWLQGTVLESQLAYWQGHLSGLPILELPTDRPRPTVQAFRGATHSLVISSSLTESLRALSRQQGTTLFMTLLAAFQILLARYTGQEDIVVGTDIANRNRAETEGLIGFFANPLVLRTDLSGNPTFRELLGRVREVCLGAYAHQDLPFEKLVAELQPKRDLSRNPLFQVLFALQNAPLATVQIPGLTFSPLAIDSAVTHSDLALLMMDTEQGLQGMMVYATALFEDATIARLLRHLEILLSQVVARPEVPIQELKATLTEADRQQQITEERELEEANLRKLRNVERKAVRRWQGQGEDTA